MQILLSAYIRVFIRENQRIYKGTTKKIFKQTIYSNVKVLSSKSKISIYKKDPVSTPH